MANIAVETKRLKIDILENEEDFINGQRDLNTTLDKTQELYNSAVSSADLTANKMLVDSGLLELQTRIARQCAKAFTVDTLVFKPREFSIKNRNHYCPRSTCEENGEPKRSVPIHTIWDKLGKLSQNYMYTTPSFSILYGTFDLEPIEAPKRKRKQNLKDKIGAQTRPEKVNQNAASQKDDVMISSAERIFSIFQRLTKFKKTNALCFYEFVTDPGSFTRTVENIFTVSLLIKDGYLTIFLDEDQLPCLKLLSGNEKDLWDTHKVQQTVVSLTVEEWKNIVETFHLKHPLIPPSQTRVEAQVQKL